MRFRNIPPTVVIAFVLCALFGGGLLLDGDTYRLEGYTGRGSANLALIGGLTGLVAAGILARRRWVQGLSIGYFLVVAVFQVALFATFDGGNFVMAAFFMLAAIACVTSRESWRFFGVTP